MTEKQIQKLCFEWQKVLRLSDWYVTVRFVPVKEMNSTSHLGMASYCRNHKIAKIKIILERDYDDNSVTPYDAERTLIHELIHLHLAHNGIDYEDARNAEQEQAINALTDAFITVKYKKK